jgi:hypothetical protein
MSDTVIKIAYLSKIQRPVRHKSGSKDVKRISSLVSTNSLFNEFPKFKVKRS